MQVKNIATAMLKELNRANKIHGGFHSPHEGYAIILEELDELFDEIKKKHPDDRRMREEAIQVGAMAMKFIASMENGWKPMETKRFTQQEFEAKCNQCQFTVMTEEEIVKLGKDPCESCCDFSNWKPKEVTD